MEEDNSSAGPAFLSQLAALINPKLAASEPKAAVQQASALYEAAQRWLDPERFRQMEERRHLEAESSRTDAETEKWFPPRERISIADAFDYQHHYKTPSGFERALRNENLLFVERLCINAAEIAESFAALSQNSALIRKGKVHEVKPVSEIEPVYEITEWTSRKATDELFRRLAANAREGDRVRKAKAKIERQRKLQRKVPKKFQGEKRKAGTKTRNIQAGTRRHGGK